MIDLHTHTRASDGQLTPTELIDQAHAAGVTTLAVTDHDTVAGIDEARQAAARHGMRLIPGIELSAFLGVREAHLLGHFVDPEEPRLRGFSELLRTEREKRMVKMLEKLARQGKKAELSEVVAASGGKNLGRPHLALVMVAHGWVRDVKEAFDYYLAVDASAYVERYKLTTRQAIELIRGAGGTATLAHAKLSKIPLEGVAQLKDEGLSGLEVAHAEHSPGMRAELSKWATQLDLVPTTGSDFHGERVVPGRKLGFTEMSEADLARLEARAGRQ